MDVPIVTMLDKKISIPTFLWKDLHSADFTFNSRFQLQLSDGQMFAAESVVRIVPRKRLVAYGIWKNKPVVAKLFFAADYSKKHMDKEIAGSKLLQENCIPTATLLYQGMSRDGRVCILIFERILGAKNLEEIWRSKKTIHDVLPLLESMMIELATQHVLGLLQHDLHLKNFLADEKNIYTLDGAEVEIFAPLLPKKLSIKNLALFLAQLGVTAEDYHKKLYRHYANARGWMINEDECQELIGLIKKWNAQRWNKYQKKIFRESTGFVSKKDNRMLIVYDRQYNQPEWLAFLRDPDMAFQHETTQILKNGRSSTVVKVILDQRELVIKRYNMKNIWHHLRRAFRPTRAVKSWRLAQKLNLFYVATAKPIAFIERRTFGMRGKSYYVTEYVSSEHASDFFTCEQDDEKISVMAKRIVRLLRCLTRLDITHGDLKMTNILIDGNQQPVIIDLDGAVEHVSLSSLKRAWKKETKRLLKNFQHLPKIKEMFAALIQQK